MEKLTAGHESLPLPRFPLPLDESQLAGLNGLDSSEGVLVGIRPEHGSVSEVPRDGWVPASVYVTELMGSDVCLCDAGR